MIVYVLNKDENPLMPCSSRKARLLLKKGKAIVIRRKPFTIRLLYGSSGYKQPITLGVDSGYLNIGLSAITNKKEVFNAEVKLRNDIVDLNNQRRMYRRSRRSRLWHRKPRFLNKKKPEGWLAPSIQHKLDSHVRIVEFVKSLLPITKIVVEIAKFDIQKIKNPNIQGKEYQEGEKLGFYNTKAYILHRDGYKCYNCHKNNIRLEIHHIVAKKDGGSNIVNNLITLCKNCHNKFHKGRLDIKNKINKSFKPQTFMSTISKILVELLKKDNLHIEETYGYITKMKREIINLSKNHSNDAFCISNGNKQVRSYIYIINQSRRNDRKLRSCYKGKKPGLRKIRYSYKPKDLIKLGDKILEVIYIHGAGKYYGKYIKLRNKLGNLINSKTSEIKIFKYRGRGLLWT